MPPRRAVSPLVEKCSTRLRRRRSERSPDELGSPAFGDHNHVGVAPAHVRPKEFGDTNVSAEFAFEPLEAVGAAAALDWPLERPNLSVLMFTRGRLFARVIVAREHGIRELPEADHLAVLLSGAFVPATSGW